MSSTTMNPTGRLADGAAGPGDAPRTLREAIPVFLHHGSPRLLIACTTLALAARGAVGDWSAWDLAPIAGLLLYWPIQEWLIHVFILHAKPLLIGRRTFDGRVPRKHRAHHRDPWNAELVFIPFHSFSYALPLVVALCFLIAPTRELALTALAVFLLGALHYEVVHFLIHTRVDPRGAYYRRLWRNHRLHHFKNEHHWFGVTRLEADRLLRTAPEMERVATSPTARTLESTLRR